MIKMDEQMLLNNLLDIALECSVCLMRLDETSKCLPCTHTFCRKCLHEIVASHKELRCPECRSLVDTRIEDLPPNVILMRILESMKTAELNNQNVNNKTITVNNQRQQQIMQSANQHSQLNNKSSSVVNNRTPIDLNKVAHAKAIYDFCSKETSDINFKKGDMIILKKRIDHNWFFGEVNGKEGFVPLNHVQVIVPLQIPQCKALYDFSMGPNEEEGCLTFKKGAIITVLRRVDANWAEGRVGEMIGIFPISFVELNLLAKQLMDVAMKHIQLQQPLHPSKIVPPTPFDLNASDSSTTTTSPNSTVSTSSSNSSTAPNSPINHASPQHIINAKEKRHSLTAFIANNTNNPVPQSNRHSAEILSIPELENSGRNNPHDAINYQKMKAQQQKPTLPATYIALYPYKAQRPDELDLKKGSIYYVTERCQDGWFKGANRTQKSGVFPGNYVTVYKGNGQSSRSHNQSSIPSTSNSSVPQGSSVKVNPPELPPRSSNSWTNTCIDSLFNRKSPSAAVNGGDSCATQHNSKEKKDSSAVSLMKRLTNIKRSKSPTTNNTTSPYSMDNPVFEDSTAGSSSNAKTNTITPVHVRSGSCPSQLLHNLPLEMNSGPSREGHHGYGGSHRVKPQKERPSVIQHRQNFEPLQHAKVILTTTKPHEAPASTSAGHSGKQAMMYHRKSQSLDANAMVAQINNANAPRIKERFRCIVPYPPNSQYELELKQGDIVFVIKKRENGWYKGTHQRTGKTGLFPASFVEPDI